MGKKGRGDGGGGRGSRGERKAERDRENLEPFNLSYQAPISLAILFG